MEEEVVSVKKSSAAKTLRPRKPIVKHVSAAPPPTPPSVVHPAVQRPSSRTVVVMPDPSSPAPTPVDSTGGKEEPLPEFISQFKGQDWFDKHFPDCDEQVGSMVSSFRNFYMRYTLV